MTSQIETFGITDRGKKRKSNEDQFLVAQFETDHVDSLTGMEARTAMMFGGDEQLLAVADGLGGHCGGAIAAAIAVQTLSEEMGLLHQAASFGLNPMERLRDAVLECNRRILDDGFHNPALFGMATTLTVALVHEEQLWIAHAGDSRAYLLRDGVIRQLTRDHSVAQLAAGKVSSASHVLWNCLGGRQSRDVTVEVSEHTLIAGDHLLLCTDGLIREVEDEEIAATFDELTSVEAASNKLVQMANDRGGPDNITLVTSSVAAPNVNHANQEVRHAGAVSSQEHLPVRRFRWLGESLAEMHFPKIWA